MYENQKNAFYIYFCHTFLFYYDTIPTPPPPRQLAPAKLAGTAGGPTLGGAKLASTRGGANYHRGSEPNLTGP